MVGWWECHDCAAAYQTGSVPPIQCPHCNGHSWERRVVIRNEQEQAAYDQALRERILGGAPSPEEPTPQEPAFCPVPGCPRHVHPKYRGLCAACYQAHRVHPTSGRGRLIAKYILPSQRTRKDKT